MRALALLPASLLLSLVTSTNLVPSGWAPAPVAHAADATRQAPLRDLLRQAGEQASAFGRALEGFVAREDYLQTIREWPGAPPDAPGQGRPMASRHLRSDLLLVHDRDRPWQVHRDVIAVDGLELADRAGRLQQLFSGPRQQADALLRAIIDESARFNLGHVERNINVPTFPLLVLHPTHQDRFAFRDRGRVEEGGRPARVVTYRERSRPRVIRGMYGRDVALEGRLLIDETDGQLLHATVEPRARDLASRLEVWFETVAPAPRRVPARFWEWYRVRGDDGHRYVEGYATYHDLRRFTTEVGAPRPTEPPPR